MRNKLIVDSNYDYFSFQDIRKYIFAMILLTDEVMILLLYGCQLTSRTHPVWPLALCTIFPVRRSYTEIEKKKVCKTRLLIYEFAYNSSIKSKLTDKSTPYISCVYISLAGCNSWWETTTYQSLTNGMTLICHDAGVAF